MKHERLMELAGVEQVNESGGIKEDIMDLVTDIVMRHFTTDDSVKDIPMAGLEDAIAEVVYEQFDQLKEAIAPAVIKAVYHNITSRGK